MTTLMSRDCYSRHGRSTIHLLGKINGFFRGIIMVGQLSRNAGHLNIRNPIIAQHFLRHFFSCQRNGNFAVALKTPLHQTLCKKTQESKTQENDPTGHGVIFFIRHVWRMGLFDGAKVELFHEKCKFLVKKHRKIAPCTPLRYSACLACAVHIEGKSACLKISVFFGKDSGFDSGIAEQGFPSTFGANHTNSVLSARHQIVKHLFGMFVAGYGADDKGTHEKVDGVINRGSGYMFR